MKIRHIKICPVIGFGYWYDDYSSTMPHGGYCHNIVLPFLRIQIGELYA
jgi:hypothetical protein